MLFRSRIGSRESWTISALREKGILENLRYHLARDPRVEFALVSPVPARSFEDICESARNPNNNAVDFFNYQISGVGKRRLEIFTQFCEALSLDRYKENDLKIAFDYLKRTYIEYFPDNDSSLLTWSELLLTGEPQSVISILLTYVENENKYHSPIYADELRKYLASQHNIHPKNLAYDDRVVSAIEELQKQFRDSIQPGLIGKTIIPREETSRLIEAVENGRDVIVNGGAGFGKSGVLYELTLYLEKENIPYLPIRLDRRIPDKNARQFGENMGLPESPSLCLASIAGDRRSVLILDQLDAIRWTGAHSFAAMDVSKEMVRQVYSLHKIGKKILVVFACRTFDMESDPEIKNLLNDSERRGFVKIPVGKLSDEQLRGIIGADISMLNKSQKRVLCSAQNLAIWMELRNAGLPPDFHSATDLMRRFWENKRQILEQRMGVSPEELKEFLGALLDYLERKGEISVPGSIGAKNPTLRDKLISLGILQRSPGRISFSHQQYMDYLIAERLLTRIYQETGSVVKWLGSKKNQSLFRREQLRQALAMLADELESVFFDTLKEILESEKVRFHLKHVVLELVGQMDKINGEVGEYFLELIKDNYWRDHVLETVFLGHSGWISFLLDTHVIQEWLNSTDKERVNQGLWLLHSVSEYMPDRVAEILETFIDKSDEWPTRILNTLCNREWKDSDKMFELRLGLARKGYIRQYIDWKMLSASNALGVIRLVEAILSTWDVDKEKIAISQERQLGIGFRRGLTELLNAMNEHAADVWDLLMPQVDRLTSIQAEDFDPRLIKWRDGSLYENGGNFERNVVGLIIVAGRVLAAKRPDELMARVADFENSTSIVIQEIIAEAYYSLPPNYADEGISWLLGNPTRFRLGFGHREPEWMPARRLIEALSRHCSDKFFKRLEEDIIHYHSPDEKRRARYCLKERRNGHICHYWGKTQYFLLPALDSKRIQSKTEQLIGVLERKYGRYSKENFLRKGAVEGGFVGSKLDPNLEKISDRAWLGIIGSKKVTKKDNHNWIQIDKDHILETSISQFADSLRKMAKRFPERFGQLALQFPDDVHPYYVSAILDGLGKKNPGEEVLESEKESWMPARVKTIEAVFDKYNNVDDRESALSFCRIIAERADEHWSRRTIEKLINLAQSFADPENDSAKSGKNKNGQVTTVAQLYQISINCVRGVAATAIGRLLWEKAGMLDIVKPGIESLIHDPHPAVRIAAIDAIEPVLNINKNLAVRWFRATSKGDLRVAASPKATKIFNYIIPSHFKKVKGIIKKMVKWPLEDVAEEGARQVTARWLFHGFFKREFKKCKMGTIAQRKGVANVAVSFLDDEQYSEKCKKILRPFMNDSAREVRDEVSRIFTKKDVLDGARYAGFIRELIQSKAFADDSDYLIWQLKESAGNLLDVADVIFSICEELSTTLIEKTRNIASGFVTEPRQIAGILLRLYDQAEGKGNKTIANRCLDIWDTFFEKRVGRTMELTMAIER